MNEDVSDGHFAADLVGSQSFFVLFVGVSLFAPSYIFVCFFQQKW